MGSPSPQQQQQPDIRKISELGAANKKTPLNRKKKKREAERGGSKRRKLRYTVHEKAQNPSVVPIPLSQGWHEEQMEERLDVGNANEGLAELGGLRVF
ncbi:hypothetical protein I308_104706 [Cryptococcus tetragattii IND107]|uniref:Apoptosis-antagonizing transcription factor C-terminal domain-containing protein n=1 Tax=Cryptococcus tetragattii IND107 TaxID=1296105 RepID=A0ABR3BPF5_9TREE